MAPGRVPRPLNGAPKAVLNARPLGGRTPQVTPTQRPTGSGVEPDTQRNFGFTDEQLEASKRELQVLRTYYGALRNKSGDRPYWVVGADKVEVYSTGEYLRDRDAFFGSATAYADYKASGRTELEAKSGSLRDAIEPPKKRRVGEWQAAQDCFYAWVRRAYENEVGSETDIPALIRAGKTDRLKAALAKARADYKLLFPTEPFQAGGFNPRPMKLHGYRLGTLSDHALGLAIDVNDERNAQFEVRQWDAMCLFVEGTLDEPTRKRLWKDTPEELHRAIKTLNDSFVTKLRGEIEKHEKPGVERKDALARAVLAEPNLKKIGLGFVSKWQNGFFDLRWELVNELREEGLKWGATFTSADLHHFELGKT